MITEHEYTWANIELSFDRRPLRMTPGQVSRYRSVTKDEADALVAQHPEWVRTFNTICDPFVTLWCDGEVPMLRAVHNNGRFGTSTVTEYELIEQDGYR